MKNFIRDYFTFNKRERNGVIALLSLIALLLVWLSTSKYFVDSGKSDTSALEKDIAQFEQGQKDKQLEQDSLENSGHDYSENEYKVPVSLTNPKAERFDFDPNGLPEKDWVRLGLSDKQVRTIKNYEAKGGKFRKKEDVKKMYCISPELYASLEPYIKIPEQKKDSVNFTQKHYEPVKPKKLMVELNTADSVQLDQLKGIGFSFAKRIIKYRNMLGGFVSGEQLLEVYGFDQEKLELVKDNITVDTSLVTKLSINRSGVEELRKHPYIKYNIANLIVNYRKQHGSYKSLSDLRKLDLVTDEVYKKMIPYLEL